MPKFTVKVSEREVDWSDDYSLLALQCSKPSPAPSTGRFPKSDRSGSPESRGTGAKKRRTRSD